MRRLEDALLLVVTARPRGIATAKLFEYLASGHPELAIGWGCEAGRIARDAGVGIVVLAESEHALRQPLHALVLRSGSDESFPRNREPIELFARPAQMQVLGGYLRALL